MYLTNLRIKNFRNHLDSWLNFGRGINLLVGNNGQGKTSVLEAISYLCLTKSFYAGNDSWVLNFNENHFEVEGTFTSEGETEYRTRVLYEEPKKEKFFLINGNRVLPLSSVIGKFPLVICSPEYSPITTGGPGERRKFVDFVISQFSSNYFQTLLEYRRVLRQRNKILFDAKITKVNPQELLEPWDEQLVKFGTTMMHERILFVEEFQPFIQKAYHHLVDDIEDPFIEYMPTIKVPKKLGKIELQELFRNALHEQRNDELRTYSTIIGPHLDEFVFKINNFDVRKYASQGQHKTFLVALKAAEIFYLKERCNETPIILLDDVFSELDKQRAKNLLSFVGDLSQTFVTTTDPYLMESILPEEGWNRKFIIQNGAIANHITQVLV
ncbi:MAG TPA: DNA replication/repair protein RecF [Bacteroidota bacterium]|nr:DNA replication/repair protein RecF [Bacteroidota bacterium]